MDTNIPAPHSLHPNNLVHPTHDRQHDLTPVERADENAEASFDEIGMFGDFCLMCGEMMNGERFHGQAYCSEECEYHQSLESESDWCDLSLEGYQLPSYGCSTAVSSAKTSPLNSPNLQASGRLAILCSGPPPCELLLPLDLGERLLGAKAVAERYLEKRIKSGQDDEKAWADDQSPLSGEDETEMMEDWTPPSKKQTPLSTGSHLKSRPALAQLTDLQGHLVVAHSDLFGPENTQRIYSQSGSLHSLGLIDSCTSAGKDSSDRTLLPNPRPSDPGYRQPKARSVSPPRRQLYHSSFSLTSLSSLSPSSRTCSQSCCSTHIV
ncbi:hypothetical protein VP01_160g14 [Puccinia sorghi]|uniref:Uncharacterized protein n=1 Tax=Puccinia sorghi TaxID=27349 RepID=A0A0L6VH46_9BASI|nr:hypothetical protein VP01_160g14 [Puccinia sorghi]